jgi:hypothetical protein
MTRAGYSIPFRSLVTFETTPARIGPEIEAMCAEIGAGAPCFLPVRPTAGARPGWCFANVDTAIAGSGGYRVPGWQIWQSRVWLNAEFHVVLGQPGGGLRDVTPKHDKETIGVFAPDDRYDPNFDFFARPNNVRRRTYEARPVADRVADLIGSYPQPVLEAQRRRAAKSGTTLEEYAASRIPPDHLERTIDAFLECAAEADSLMVPGPTGMTCRSDRRLMALEMRKLELSRRIEKEWAARPAQAISWTPSP